MERFPPRVEVVRVQRVLVGLGLVASLAPAAVAAEATPEGIELFEKKIRPVLVQHCYKCHSAEAGKRKGGLHLDTRDAVQAGGDTGPAVVPGDPDKSVLLRAIRRVEGLEMP